MEREIEVRPKTFYSHAFGAIDLDGWMVEFKKDVAKEKKGHTKPIKMLYKFLLYDPKTGRTTRVGEMPERRSDPRRQGRDTVIKWIKLTYGEEWYEKNKSNLGIVKVKIATEN